MIEKRECGLWWPAGEVSGRHVILNDVDAAVGTVLGLVEGRRCVVQAGANVGVYGFALAEHFAAVICAEPDPVNFTCLGRNWAEAGGPEAMECFGAAFGAEAGACHTVEVSPQNCGAHRIEAGGDVRVITIDSLSLEACDCIWGDVEGSELFMLRGAEDTIRRLHPLIVMEEKGLGAIYGVGPTDIEDWLGERGYSPAGRIGNDRVYRHG